MQTNRKPYGMTTPCDNCPFRSDVEGYLTKGRVTEIERGLTQGEFYCHKTTNADLLDEEGGDFYVRTGDEQHCAGALILLEKLERPSQMMRISERIGMYDRRKLNMDAPVHKSFAAMRRAMK